MTTPLDQTRAAFEAWHTQKHFALGGLNGQYELQSVWDRWELWQAAIASRWQPIETAPKDGQEVILRRGKRVGSAMWVHWPSTDFEEAGEGWSIGFDSESWDGENAPTEWQPLPAPPTPQDPPIAAKAAKETT